MAPVFTTVLPWGRALGEYRAMFALEALPFGPALSRARVLDVAGGPASFTAEMTAAGAQAVACDPLYEMDGAEIAARIEDARREIMAVVRRDRERFVWTSLASPAEMERRRLAAMARFLEDYPTGREAGRYRPDALPALAFPDGRFDLVLCSHFLFTYSAQLDADFHLRAVAEMARVGREVRVYPLLDGDGEASAHLEAVLAGLRRAGYEADTPEVPYEFQRGGKRMLRVRGPAVAGRRPSPG